MHVGVLTLSVIALEKGQCDHSEEECPLCLCDSQETQEVALHPTVWPASTLISDSSTVRTEK